MSGKFINGRLDGYGEVRFVEKEKGVGGDYYIGFFKDGKRSGQGFMKFNQYNEFTNNYEYAEY